MKLTACPFCGMVSDTDWDDTLYPTGSFWADHPDGFRHYFSRALYRGDESKMPEPEGKVFQIVCSENYGGCGAEIHGDSIEEVIQKWERRS